MADFLATYRDLDISAAITLRSGKQITADADDIYNYNISGTAATSGIPIGEAIAQTFSLGVSVAACPYTAEELDSAEVRVRIGVRNSNSTAYSYKDAGAWYVTSVGAPEGASALTLKGTDALGLWFDSVLEDSEATYPASLRGLLEKVAGAAGVSVSSRRWLHDDAAISVMPTWAKNTTLREVVGYIAACAGGFAQIDMSGELEIITNGQGDVVTLDTAAYNTYTPTGGARFKLNCLRVTYPLTDDESESEPIRFAIDADVEDNATNCAEIIYNPIITDAMASAVVKELSKSGFAGGDVVWLGDPSVICGHVLRLTPIDGVERTMLVNSFSLTFDGGLSGQLHSAMPTLRETSTHYSSSGSVFNPDGSLPVSKVDGFSGGVINAMLGKFDRIVAGEISTDRFFAQMGAVVLLEVQDFKANTVNAKILTAGSITTAKLAAEAVTADKIKAGTITADKIAAKTITADSGIIDNGAIGTAQIADGSITSAKIVSLDADVIKTGTLSAERIVLVGDDGIIYKLNVASSGLSLSELSADQYKNYINGTVIVAKSITAAQIAAQTITANEILAGTITSKQINVTELFANEATIDALNTVDITGNGSLRLLVNNLPIVKIHYGQLAQDESLADQGIRVYSDYSFEQADGTPSPTNILPITGRSSAKLVRCGKNMCDMSAMTAANGAVLEYADDALRIYTSVNKEYAGARSPVMTLRAGVKYTLSAKVTNITAGTLRIGVRNAATNAFLSGSSIQFSATGSKHITFTVSEDAEAYVSPLVTWSSAAAGDATFANIQLELGDNATAYERYSGDTYEVDFGGMHSGRLDWASGRFAADRGLVSFDGTENWKYYSAATYPYWYYDFADYGTAINDRVQCSHFKRLSIASTTNNIGVNIWNTTATNACRIGVRPGLAAVTDLATWKEYLAAQAAAGTPVQIVYQFAEPYEIQFDACPVWAVEGLNTVIADGIDGRIEFGHDSLTHHLQSQIDMLPGKITLAVTESKKYTDTKAEELQAQINLVPDKITLAVTESKEYTDDAVSDVTATGVKTATSSVVITKDEVRINSEKTAIAIPAADSADGEEIVSIDDEGLRTTVLTAEEIHSDSVIGAIPGSTYTPANAGELQAIFDGLKCKYITGGTTVDASAVDGGSCTLRGIQGNGIFKITGGKLNSLKLMHCRCHVQIESMTFDSSGTAVEAQTCEYVYLTKCSFSASTGVFANLGGNVVINSCTGACTTLLKCSAGSTVTVNGSSCPSGVLGSVTGEVYSLFEFAEPETEPEASIVTTATLNTNNSHTWGGDWLSTSTFGKALYQGATGDGELRRGCMWFPLTAISGKQIISATLTLKRVSGIGGGGSVKIGIYGTTAAGASGNPAVGTKYAEINLANGASGSVDVTSAVQALADGTIKGLMIYDNNKNKFNGKSYTYGYCKLYGDGSGNEPSISVTYK